MNYKSIYTKLCDKGKIKVKEPDTFYERHHIIPRSFGGNNSTENITVLTLKEHYIAHRLLVALYPESIKMQLALWNMCNISPSNAKYERYKPSARIYDRLRSDYMNRCKGDNHPLKGRKMEQWQKDFLREVNIGKKHPTASLKLKGRKQSEERKQKARDRIISQETIDKLKSYKHTPESRKKISEASKRPCKEETRRKISEAQRGREGRGKKPVLQFSKTGKFINEWDSLASAGIGCSIDYKSIQQCCRGRSTASGGYRWIYKSDYNIGKRVATRRHNQKDVHQYDSCNNFIRTFISTEEASNELGIRRGSISESLRMGYKCFGFYFKRSKI